MKLLTLFLGLTLSLSATAHYATLPGTLKLHDHTGRLEKIKSYLTG
ncbi:hypothetical protein DR90_1143 [Moraxella catarrhalis]|nr:hypothetical protein [Moraxella catarrhalis]AIK00232.1 hypothetical protein DR90_1143 [Moraxella catarrhalis]